MCIAELMRQLRGISRGRIWRKIETRNGSEHTICPGCNCEVEEQSMVIANCVNQEFNGH